MKLCQKGSEYNMKISLLYKTEEHSPGTDAIYDLSVDRCTHIFCPDNTRADRFLHVLSHPLTLWENIVYRQQILGDFIADESLFDELKTIFSRYDKIKGDWIELRSNVRTAGAGNREAMLERAFASLKTTSVFPRTLMSFIRAIADTLSSRGIKSEGLSEIRDYCLKILDDKSIDEIVNISDLFGYRELWDHDFNIIFRLSEDMKIRGCELYDIREKPKKHRVEQREKLYERQLNELAELSKQSGKPNGEIKETQGLLSKLFSGARANNTVVPTETAIAKEAYDTSIAMLCESFCRIDEVLTEITGEIYDIFHGISTEMQFYDAALRYCAFVNDAEIPLTMPQILPAEEERTDLIGLRDLFLSCEGKTGEQIIPNDLHLAPEIEGMLIRGSNNTGKTVFLRSVGIAQLFAQSGLPVCADSAVISIKHGIFSHFSAAEEEFTRGDTAGRFEGEVRCISGIIEKIRPHSLILLNETFQTTAYREGADGMRAILSVFPKLSSKYIFVTHLISLYDDADGKKVLLMQTTLTQNESGYDEANPGKRFTLTEVKKSDKS